MGDENWGEETSKPAAAAVGGEGDAPKTGFGSSGVRINIIVIIFNRINLV